MTSWYTHILKYMTDMVRLTASSLIITTCMYNVMVVKATRAASTVPLTTIPTQWTEVYYLAANISGVHPSLVWCSMLDW